MLTTAAKQLIQVVYETFSCREESPCVFLGRGKTSWGSDEKPFPVSLHASSLTGGQLFLLLSQLLSAHSVWSLSNLFETRALGWIQRGLRQPWPVHGSAADWISAWSLAHSTARNSSSHGSCRWAMLSSGEGCNFLEGSEAGQNGAVENQPSLRQAAPRGSGRVSAGPRAGQSHCQRCPCHSGLGVRCCRLHTGLLNVSLTSLAVTYPHCLVIADEKAVPSLAWFVSHFFYLCVPAPPTHPQCLGNGCRSGVPGSRSSLQRQGSGSTGGADPACPFRGWHQYCPVEKGDLYLRGCAPSPRWPGQHHAWLSRSRCCSSARLFPHALGKDRHFFFTLSWGFWRRISSSLVHAGAVNIYAILSLSRVSYWNFQMNSFLCAAPRFFYLMTHV